MRADQNGRVTIPRVSFRTARAGDVDAVLAFWSVAAEDAHRPADTPAAVRALLARDAEALLLAVADGAGGSGSAGGQQVVGTVIGGWDGWRAHIYRLAVDPRHRRAGIGGQLIARANERLAALGATRSDAMVLDKNYDAHGAWQAAGYRRQAEWGRWVRPLP